MNKLVGLTEAPIPQTIKKSVGDVLFGSNPIIAKIQDKPTEKDTPYEDDLVNKIKNWTDKSDEKSEMGVVSTIADLVKLKKYFPEVLNPPYGDKVYRGTSVKLPELSKFIKENPEHDMMENGMVRFKTPYPYTPKREVSSWSASIFYASGFQGKSFESAINVPVIFETTVDDSFIMNPQVMNVIFKSTGGVHQDFIRDEDEVMKYNPSGTYYLILSQDEYEIFSPSED
jgi:hypothetical protein